MLKENIQQGAPLSRSFLIGLPRRIELQADAPMLGGHGGAMQRLVDTRVLSLCWRDGPPAPIVADHFRAGSQPRWAALSIHAWVDRECCCKPGWQAAT